MSMEMTFMTTDGSEQEVSFFADLNFPSSQKERFQHSMVTVASEH